MTDSSSFKLNSLSVEVFKTLAIKELTQKKLDKEKELAELIKNGLVANESNDKLLNNCSNCNKERGAF